MRLSARHTISACARFVGMCGTIRVSGMDRKALEDDRVTRPDENFMMRVMVDWGGGRGGGGGAASRALLGFVALSASRSFWVLRTNASPTHATTTSIWVCEAIPFVPPTPSNQRMAPRTHKPAAASIELPDPQAHFDSVRRKNERDAVPNKPQHFDSSITIIRSNKRTTPPPVLPLPLLFVELKLAPQHNSRRAHHSQPASGAVAIVVVI